MNRELSAILLSGMTMAGCALAFWLWGNWKYSIGAVVSLLIGGLTLGSGLYALLLYADWPVTIAATAGMMLPCAFFLWPASRYKDARFFYTLCQTYLPGMALLFLMAYCFERDKGLLALFLLFTGAAAGGFLFLHYRTYYRAAQRVMRQGWLRLTLLTVGGWLPLLAAVGWAHPDGAALLGLLSLAAGVLAAGWILEQQLQIAALSADNRAARARLREVEVYHDLAYRDALTKVGNRAALDRDIQVIVRQSIGWISCWMMDLNNLKKTNDTHGHAAGDRLLVGLCTLAHDVIASSGSVYRIGGDEFLILLPRIPASGRLRLEQTFREALAEHNSRQDISISVAVGGATTRLDGMEAGAAMAQINRLVLTADQAMYAEKQRQSRETVSLV